MACDISHPDVKNSIYRNMVAYKTWYGIRIKSCGNIGNQWNATVYNITYENITFFDVKYGIDVNVYNESVDGDGFGYSNITNILFDNIGGTVTNYVGHLDCSDSPPCQGLEFKNIDLKNVGGDNEEWMCSDNVYGNAVNVTPPLTCLK